MENWDLVNDSFVGWACVLFPVPCSTVRDAPDVVANGDILLINEVDDSKLRSPAACRAIKIMGHKWRKYNFRDGEKKLVTELATALADIFDTLLQASVR